MAKINRILISIVLVSTGLAAVSYYAYIANMQSASNEGVLPGATVSTQTPPANWPSYSEDGWLISYPPTLTPRKASPTGHLTFFTDHRLHTVLLVDTTPLDDRDNGAAIRQLEHRNSANEESAMLDAVLAFYRLQFEQLNLATLEVSNARKISVAGRSAVRYIWKFKGAQPYYIKTTFAKGGTLIDISTSADSDSRNTTAVQLYDTAVASFRFR